MSVHKPRRRFGWVGRSIPADWGSGYAEADVKPGDRIIIRGYGPVEVLSWDDPEVSSDHWIRDKPQFNDGYVYGRTQDGFIDGYPPSMINL